MYLSISPADGSTDITIIGVSDFNTGDNKVTVRFPKGAAIEQIEIEGEVESAIHERHPPDEAAEKAIEFAVDQLVVVPSFCYERQHSVIVEALDNSDLNSGDDYSEVTPAGTTECQLATSSGFTVVSR